MGRIAAPVHKLWKSVLPQWKLLGWPRWDINLSWEGHFSGKMRTKIGWMFFAHHKNLIMGEGGRIAGPVHKLWKSILPQWNWDNLKNGISGFSSVIRCQKEGSFWGIKKRGIFLDISRLARLQKNARKQWIGILI